MSRSKQISLVLGSGGARGYAHIGVIEVLEEMGYEITSVSGSSMGALIGALYACGELKRYKEWVLGLDILDVAKLVDFSLAGTGIIQGDKVIDVIEEMMGEVLIEELPVAYTAVATDIIKQKEVWIQKGRLLDAVRASIAIPTIFTPKTLDGRHLIDGGVLNPLPIAPTISDNTDITIAVNLSGTSKSDYALPIPQNEQEKVNAMKQMFLDMVKKAEALFTRDKKSRFEQMDMFDIMGRTIDTMQHALMECKMAGYAPDIIIDIPGNAAGFYEFNKAYELIELGKRTAKEQLKELTGNDD